MVYIPLKNTVAPLPQGSNGSLCSSVLVTTEQNAMAQNKLNQLAGSGRRKSKQIKGGAADSILVPVVQPIFKDTCSGNNTISANVRNLTILGATENENSKYDSLVGVKTGGNKRSTLKGGKHVHWGCMSGGKSRRKKSIKKMRRSKRSRRRGRGRGRKSK
jgi:hypothetical protein